MGVLDRLDSEAREARQRREAEAEARAREQSRALARLSPALERSHHYLAQVAARLNELDRAVVSSYDLDGPGLLGPLRQLAYRVVGDDGDAVRLQFECRGATPLEAKIQGHARAQALARKLREARLTCTLTPLSRRVTQLRVEPVVPVRITMQADAGSSQLRLELRNLPALGVQRYSFAPERIDDALLDALASLVLREPSGFDEMTGSVVDEDQRAELKRRLARDQRRRDVELAGGIRRALFPATEWFRRQFLGG